MTSIAFPVPAFVRTAISYFPLHTYPAIPPPPHARIYAPSGPTVWISPPPTGDVLSADVECVKWQAYLAFRGLSDIRTRSDIVADGAIDAKLPNLHVPSDAEAGELLAAGAIPAWLDANLGALELDGYRNEAARDESLAWLTLLESSVLPALLQANPAPWSLLGILAPTAGEPSDGNGPFFGMSTINIPFARRPRRENIQQKYEEAINALSDRLGNDLWFLGSQDPTLLDAAVYAYMRCLLRSKDIVRTEVTKRVNLIAWDRRVGAMVRSAFQRGELDKEKL